MTGQQPEPFVPPGPDGAAPPPPPAAPTVEYTRLSPLTPVVKGWVGLLAVIAVVGRQFLENGGLEHREGGYSVWLIILAVFGVISVVTGWISWRTTGYAVAADALHVRRSFISQQTDTVVYRRIQSVDIVRPLAARLIGVAGLRIDVGGDRAPRLEYLSMTKAEQVRDELLSRAAVAHRVSDPALADPTSAPSPDAAEVAAGPAPVGVPLPGPAARAAQGPEIVRVQCTPQQIVLGTLTSSEFVLSTLSIIVFGIVPTLLAHQLVTLGILVPLGFGIVGIVTNRLFKQWNYRLATTSDGVVRISRGLTDTVSQTVPTDRVQGFSICQSVFAKPFGLWQVHFEVFGYSGEKDDQGGSTVLLPAGSWSQVLTVLDTVWPGFDPAQVPQQPLPRRARWLHPFAFKSYAWGLDDQVVLSRGRLLVHRINVVHQARAQSWTIEQGPLQRRLRLASSRVDITRGPVNVVLHDLDVEVARQVTDDLVRRGRLAREAPWLTTAHQPIVPAAAPQWPMPVPLMQPPEQPDQPWQPR